MDEKELRDLLSKRLYIELQIFKDDMLHLDKMEIYGSSYKIEIYVNLYEILLEQIDNLSEDIMRRLLRQNFSIIGSLYQEWLFREDSFVDELRDYIGEELENILLADSSVYGKEGENGTGFDKAA